MDENIQEVATMVCNLKNMAYDMGTEISNQNRQLDRIREKVRRCTRVEISRLSNLLPSWPIIAESKSV